jgi:hypothetical protein
MGYYTRHELTIVSGDKSTDHEKQISEAADYHSCFDDEIKWYDHVKDMKSYSLKYPDTVFCLEGEGEETGDIWKAYFKNGKMFKTKAIMTFESYDESKLT